MSNLISAIEAGSIVQAIDSIAVQAFKDTFQLNPIFLTGGIAGGFPGGIVPITSLLQGNGLLSGILGALTSFGQDSNFANFEPLAGATLIDQEFGTYPFANQQVAANAVIQQPLAVSLRMISPVRIGMGYSNKLSVMTALKTTLEQHNNNGGTYTVATPSFFYTNGLLKSLSCTDAGETKQSQMEWRWDFFFPLLTLQQAQGAQNNLMNQLSNGTQINGQPSLSGLPSSVGNPASNATSSIIPSSQGSAGSGISTSFGF